jgi:hypothetical protein
MRGHNMVATGGARCCAQPTPYDLPQGAGDAGAVDDPWDAPTPALPVVYLCGRTFRQAARTLVVAGGDVTVSLAALRDAGMPCDGMVVQLDAECPGPELRPVIDDWNPFDRPKKKNKKQKATRR